MMASVTDWAPVASAAFAAAASTAAWLGVRETRRAAESAIRPELAVSAGEGPDGLVDVLVHNAGRGVARHVRVMLTAEGQRLDAWTRAILSADETFRIATTIKSSEGRDPSQPPDSNWLVVVSCRDVRQRMWAWNQAGERQKIPTTKGLAEPASIFAGFWPQAEFTSLPLAGFKYRYGAPRVLRLPRDEPLSG
jgi:hypothetical protein